MFIKNIKIINESNGKIIREQTFHKGTNFVVDSEDSASHNTVGKTTFLNLINIALGAKEKKLLYYNKETNSTNEELKKYIINNKISVQLNLNDTDQDIELNVALYPRGKRSINGKNYSQNEYNAKLNSIIFKNEQNIPTFRQLLKSFLRIDLGKDDNSFLRNLPITTTISTYRAVYNYLFEISDSREDTERDKLNRRIRDVEQAKKRYKEVSNVSEKYELEQIIATLRIDEGKLSQKLNDMVSRSDFEKNRNHFNNVRNKYTRLLQKIDNIKFYIKENNNNINENETKSKEISNSLIHVFFNEVHDLIPDLNKEFNELVEFNRNIQKNKIKYFTEINEKAKLELQALEKQKNELVEKNKDYISLIQNNNIDEYYRLSDECQKIRESIANKQSQLDELNNFETEISNLKSKLKDLNENIKNSTDYSDRMRQFNKYFRPYALKINGKQPLLTYNPDIKEFPLKISALSSGVGTGSTKSLIAAYDLAYQKFAQELNKNVPNFIVQDVLENIEGENLRSIINISNKLNVQYIIAILKEKLDSSGLSEKEQKRLTVVSLSNKDKLFKDNDNRENFEDSEFLLGKMDR